MSHSSVPDQAQRLEALDPNTSFIVQAPAGSGKTELLIQRYLVLLSRVENPEEIVAITFTRKAAAEMRHRIIGALQKARGRAPTAPHEKHTWELARSALEHNERKQWKLLENPLRLRIQTIDSLCSLIVRRMPWISRMGALIKPEENAFHLYEKAARRTLELIFSERSTQEVSLSITILLRHLDNHMANGQRLLGVMLSTRDQWSRHIDQSGSALATTRIALESTLTHVVEAFLGQLVAAFPSQHADEVVELSCFAANTLTKNGKESPIRACADLTGLPDASAESLPSWLGIAELFLTAKGVRRKAYNINQGFPADRKELKTQIKDIQLDEETINQLHDLRSLPPSSYEEDQWEVLKALIHLLPEAVAQLRNVFMEEGCVDFTEISIAAQTAMRGQVSFRGSESEIAMQHLLVDEFQDTSQSQYELLERLIHDWTEEEQTLFLVGDPMQSIYGFREAEVSLFSRTRESGLGPIIVKSLVLETNFRSSKEVVQWVNTALGQAFPLKEDSLTSGVSYSPSKAFRTDIQESNIQIHPFFFDDQDGQAEKVVEIIEQTRAHAPEDTIAVLVQARSHLSHIIPLLRSRGIGFRSVEIDPLAQRPVVRDLLALTQALLHLGNRVAWLTILRAPWCGLTLADLQRLVNNDFGSAIIDLLQAHQGNLSVDGQRRVARILPILVDALELRGRLAVRRWVEGVWIALGGPACLQTRVDMEDAHTFLNFLEESVDALDFQDENKFIKEIERLYAPSDVDAGIELQLLTAHKSKGLEFDTVILPGLGKLARGDDRLLLRWQEYREKDQSQLLLAPIPKTGGDEDRIYEYLRIIEKKRRDHERTRLLYVACTRARKDLHLIGHIRQSSEDEELNSPPSRSLLSKIWNEVEPIFIEAWKDHPADSKASDQAEPEVEGEPLYRLSSNWNPSPLPEDLIWKASRSRSEDDMEERQPVYEWVGDLSRRVGIVVHRILQEMWYPEKVVINDQLIRGALSHEGVSGENLEKALLQVKVAIKNTLEDPRGRWVLSQHGEDQREYALTAVTKDGVRRFILDRTFVQGDQRWIVDYKTSTHLGSDLDDFLDSELKRYRSKMEMYARVIRAIDSRPIFLGLYFPLLKGWREWQYIKSEKG